MMEAEVSGVSEQRSGGTGEASYCQLLLLQFLCGAAPQFSLARDLYFILFFFAFSPSIPFSCYFSKNPPCRLLSTLQSICRTK